MPFRFWHGTLEDNLAPDRASKLKPKSAEIFTLLSTVLTSCHRVLCSGSFTGNVCGMHPCTSWQKWKKKRWKISEMKTVRDSRALWRLRSCQVDHIRSSGPAATSTSPPAPSLKLSMSELSGSQPWFGSTLNFDPRFYRTAGCMNESHCEKYSGEMLKILPCIFLRYLCLVLLKSFLNNSIWCYFILLLHILVANIVLFSLVTSYFADSEFNTLKWCLHMSVSIIV